MEYNKDQGARDKIIFGKKDIVYSGGTCYFCDLSLAKLKKLVKQGFADPEEYQNSAPSIGDILEFMKANPRFKAHGYVVHANRSDYRLSIEGVKLDVRPTVDEREAFTDMFRCADDFDCDSNGCFCWYD